MKVILTISIVAFSFAISCKKTSSSDEGEAPVVESQVQSQQQVEVFTPVTKLSPKPTPPPTPVPNAAPTVSIEDVSSSVHETLLGESISIDFSASDAEGSAGVSLFFSSTYMQCSSANEASWTKITDLLTTSDSTYAWTPASVGEYFVCIKVDDGEKTAYATAGGAINVKPNDMVVWLKADEGVALDGSLVTSWADQSGNGNDASQADASYKPTFVSDALNGLPAISFDGVDDFFSDDRSYSIRTVFTAQKINMLTHSDQDLGQVIGDYPSGVHVAFDVRNDPVDFSFDGGSGAGKGMHAFGFDGFSSSYISGGGSDHLGSGDPCEVCGIFDVMSVKFETSVSITKQTIAHLGVANFAIGSHHFGGQIGEVVVFDRELSDLEIASMRRYLVGRWSESVSGDPSPEVSNLSATALSSASISLAWDSQGGTTTGFQISYTQGATAPTSCAQGNVIGANVLGLSTNYTINSLDSETQYSFRVCSVNAAAAPTYYSPGVLATSTTLQSVANPPATDSLSHWLSADVGITADGDGKISLWSDRSGSSFNAAQANATYQPKISVTTLGGKPVVEFDGVNDFLSGLSAPFLLARTVVVVFRVDSSLQVNTDLAQFWGQYSGVGHVSVDPRGGNLRGFSFDGSTTNTADYQLDSEAIVENVEDSNSVQWTYDEWHTVVTEFSNDRSITDFAIGWLSGSFSIGEHHLGGYIAEILVYDSILSAEEKTAVRNYFGSKYGI